MESNQQNLLEQLFQLQWYLRRYQMQHHREFGPMGSPYQGQGRILALLKLKPQISQKELSTILDIRSQSLGELLAKLERQGYITRTPAETDRRSMDINLTDAGRAAAEQPQDPPDLESVFDCLTAEEQDALSSYLARLIQRFEETLGSSEPEPGIPGRPDFGDRRHFHHPFRQPGMEPPSGFGRGGPFFDREDPRGGFRGPRPEDPRQNED